MGYGESASKADGVLVKPSNAEQPSNSGGSDDDSSPLEDVTICDICGDAGREDLLVVCCKCSDGAEHTYCMRIMLHEVPKVWICEDCLRLDDDKQSQTEVEKSDASTEVIILKVPPQDVDMTGQSVVNVCSITSPKRLGASKSVGDKESSSAPAEAPLGVVDSTFPKRKRTPGEEIASMRPSKALRCQDSAVKKNSDLPTMDSGPSRRLSQNGSLLPVSGPDLSKSSRLQTQAGALTKSKSFSVWDKKPKTQLLEKAPINPQRKVSAVRSLSKSVSFGNSATSDRSVPDTRTSVGPLKKVHEQNDLKRSGSMKNGDSLEKVNDLKRTGSMRNDDSLEKSNDLKRPGSTKNGDSLEKATKIEFGKPSQILPLEGRLPVNVTSFDKKLASFRETGSMTENKLCDLRNLGNTKESGTENACESKKISSPSKSIELLSSPCVVQDPSVPFDHLNSPFAVPMFDYIWKGEFVVKGSGSRLPRLSYKIQAYMSTIASLRIPEVVKDFSDKITLDEVSRPSIWPKKFTERNQPRDESIGLYFFAEDIHSYPNYKSLLRCMIDYDLALKGNFNGIELFIFSSNLLPENSQRWNNMLFLWGTFRRRTA